jgi:hypothetical protein
LFCYFPLGLNRIAKQVRNTRGCYNDSPSIIKYLEPKTRDLFTARYANSIFDEEHFPALVGGLYLNNKECREIDWTDSSIQSFDPRTKDTELEV